MSETTLWTNPSPTSAFASQTVALSDDISNYKFIGIQYKAVKSGSLLATWYAKVDEWLDTSSIFRLCLFATISSSNYVRNVTRESDTSIGFSSATKWNASGTNNDNVIPIKVIGLK